MDLKSIKNRLEAMNTKPNSGEKKPNNRFKPAVGKQVIRVVPNKFDKQNPFTEVLVYYGIGKRVMISPTTWGEKDPIVDFTKVLRKSSEKDNWKLAGKLSPKMRVFIPVIVRGEEDKGVKLWEFGKEMYMDFLNLADNEDIGDFTDIVDGRDITITTVGPETTGTEYNKSSIMPRTKQTPLSEDKALVKKWLDEQPNPIDGFTKYSFDEMKAALQEYLSPSEEEEKAEADEPEIIVAPKAAAVAKTSKASKFENLFNEGK